MCLICEAGNRPRRAFYTIQALEVIGTILPEIAYSPNRSKRLWKKLRKKGARPLYDDRVKLIRLPPGRFLLRLLDAKK